METARPDRLFNDPFAERLAGQRGTAIARGLPRLPVMNFGVAVRTRFIDELIAGCIRDHGVKTVLSVGCGLDSRPWRLDLPPALDWIEADFPAILEYKNAVMAGETPRCRLEQIAVDLNDADQRREMFCRLSESPGFMITEGLLAYLPGSTIEGLACEAPVRGGIHYWLSDITSPAFARMVGMDLYDDVQKMRAADHLHGLEILDVLARHGWMSARARRYAAGDLFEFAGERIKSMAEAREKAGLPPPASPPPDDPTGVHVFRYAR
jgi:methyltransferase (TIGR00027 family)